MLSLDILHPLSKELPTVLQVDFPLNATGEVGFLNEGVIPKCLSRKSGTNRQKDGGGCQ